MLKFGFVRIDVNVNVARGGWATQCRGFWARDEGRGGSWDCGGCCVGLRRCTWHAAAGQRSAGAFGHETRGVGAVGIAGAVVLVCAGGHHFAALCFADMYGSTHAIFSSPASLLLANRNRTLHFNRSLCTQVGGLNVFCLKSRE